MKKMLEVTALVSVATVGFAVGLLAATTPCKERLTYDLSALRQRFSANFVLDENYYGDTPGRESELMPAEHSD